MQDGRSTNFNFIIGFFKMTSNSQIKNLLFLGIGAVCVSFAPVFVKLINVSVMGPTAIGFWRMFIGGLILFIFAVLKGESIRIPKTVLYFTILAGFLFYGDLFVWHRSILLVGAGISTILGNTQVFWMAFFGILIFKEKLTFTFLVSILCAFIGVTLLIGIGSGLNFTEPYINGIIYGLLTGFFYSSYMATLKKAGHYSKTNNFFTLMAWTSIICSIFLAISAVIENDPYLPTDSDTWLSLLGLAIVVQSVGWWIIAVNLPKIKAAQSGMILLLQPTLATIWGALLFSERLSFLQLVGAIITLIAIYVGSASLSRNKKRV
jgi:drug/metabolite transporter (DMT)-like permease